MIVDAPSSPFVERFHWVANKLERVKLSKFATLARAAWFCRNKANFEPNLVLDAIAEKIWL